MSLGEIKSSITDRLSLLRSIERIVFSSKFIRAYDQATILQKIEFEYYINNCDKINLLGLIKFILNEKNIFQLRQKAKSLGIRNYNKIPKWILESEIKAHEKD